MLTTQRPAEWRVFDEEDLVELGCILDAVCDDLRIPRSASQRRETVAALLFAMCQGTSDRGQLQRRIKEIYRSRC